MRRIISLALLVVTLAGGVTAAAQTDAGALALARREADEAARRAERFDRQAAQAMDEAGRARAKSEALVSKVEAAEAEISAAQAELRIVDAASASRRARLAERQEPFVRLTAALQTMARRPPALALIQPGSVDDLARVRALLGATLPVIRARTAGLRAEIASAEKARLDHARVVQSLAASRDRLGRQRLALARLETSQRQRSQRISEAALSEADRALAFSEDARELTRLMGTRRFRAQIEESLAALPAPMIRSGSETRKGATGPAPYRLPLTGRLVSGFGGISDAGIHSRGLSFAPAPDATVIAPRAGRVAYAGRFRSYGEIVIVDHGGGWTTTITNLKALRVTKNDAVQAGDTLGRAGAGPVAIELRRNGVPQSIASLIAPG